MAKNIKSAAVPMDLTVVTASYDMCDNDGIYIGKPVNFTDSASAAKFIAEGIQEAVDDCPDDEIEGGAPSFESVHRTVTGLEPGGEAVFDAPAGLPSAIQY